MRSSPVVRYTAPITFTLFGIFVLVVMVIAGFQFMILGKTPVINYLDAKFKYFITPDEPVEKS